jgi:hypothetical protein
LVLQARQAGSRRAPGTHTLTHTPDHAQAQQQGRAPWALSFSYGRALQASVLKLWAEDRSRAADAQAVAVALVKANAAAARGLYEGPHPSLTAAAPASLHETFRGHRSDTDAAQPAAVAAV